MGDYNRELHHVDHHDELRALRQQRHGLLARIAELEAQVTSWRAEWESACATSHRVDEARVAELEAEVERHAENIEYGPYAARDANRYHKWFLELRDENAALRAEVDALRAFKATARRYFAPGATTRNEDLEALRDALSEGEA